MWPSGLPLLNLKQGGHIRRTMVRIACDNKCTFISMNEAQFCLVRWLKFRERFRTVVQFEPCWDSWNTFDLFCDNSAEITNIPCHCKIFLFSRCLAELFTNSWILTGFTKHTKQHNSNSIIDSWNISQHLPNQRSLRHVPSHFLLTFTFSSSSATCYFCLYIELS